MMATGWRSYRVTNLYIRMFNSHAHTYTHTYTYTPRTEEQICRSQHSQHNSHWPASSARNPRGSLVANTPKFKVYNTSFSKFCLWSVQTCFIKRECIILGWDLALHLPPLFVLPGPDCSPGLGGWHQDERVFLWAWFLCSRGAGLQYWTGGVRNETCWPEKNYIRF